MCHPAAVPMRISSFVSCRCFVKKATSAITNDIALCQALPAGLEAGVERYEPRGALLNELIIEPNR